MAVKEDGSLSLSGISVKDVDAGRCPMSMVLRVEHGVLTLLGTAGAVSVQGAGTNVVTLVGSLDDLNQPAQRQSALRAGQGFLGRGQPHHHHLGSGQHGAGGALTDTATVGITVTAEADEPRLGLRTHDIHALQRPGCRST